MRLAATSIRFRLTVWYALVLCLMMGIYAAATFVAVRHQFVAQLDRQLYDDFETAEGLVTRTADGRLAWMGDRRSDPHIDDERGTEVWSLDGRPIYRSPISTALPQIGQQTTSDPARYESIVLNGHRWRLLTGTERLGDDAVVLRVARLEDRLRSQLQAILTVLVLGVPLVVVLAGIGGYILARGALSPLDRLASAARRITADRLHERVSVPNQQDEIGRLAAVINDTFARLESSFERLRRFTADASHELRTPLAIIRGIGESRLKEPGSPAEYQEAMGSILEEIDRLTTLVDTLLRLSHADAGAVPLSRELVDLGALTRGVISSLAVLAEERNQMLNIDAPDAAVVSVDPLVLREAIANIMHNAIKFSPQASTIDVRVRAHGPQVTLDVADHGAGIPVEDRRRIFDRFVRVDEGRSRDGGGSGLGLAIAKWAVEIHGGHIAVDGGPDGGSVFRITLPGVEPA